MGEFFTADYTGAPFQLFGPSHLIALSVIAVFNVLLIAFRRQIPQHWQVRIRYGLATLILLNEMVWHAWNWATAQWTIQKMLPLHLCSVLVFLSAALLISKSQALYEIVYFLGIAGASQALLTPDAGRYGFPHLRFFQIFISHGIIVTAAIFITTVEGYRPTPRSLTRVAIRGTLYMGFVAIVNTAIGSNYLFIAHKPETASLLDVLPPWPWYIPIIELIGLAMMCLLYAPFAWRDWRRRTGGGGKNKAPSDCMERNTWRRTATKE